MEFKASDLIDSVVEEAKRNGITIAQQLMSNRMLYLTSKEAIPISEQTDDEFLMCALESNDISPITLLRELRNRTLNFDPDMIDAMIISLRKELLSYIEWWRLYELFKILELPQCEMPNLSKDDIAKMLDIFSLTDEELYDEAPDSFFYILRELEKRLPFTLNPVPDGNDSEQSQDIKPTMSEPSNSPTATKQALPTVCNTDRERKYYARAIELGYMERTATGYKWVFGGDRGAKARLAYFLERVYCPKHTDTINAEQYRQLERLFGKTRLDRAVQTNADTGKTQRVKQWRAEIDKNVFFD